MSKIRQYSLGVMVFTVIVVAVWTGIPTGILIKLFLLFFIATVVFVFEEARIKFK